MRAPRVMAVLRPLKVTLTNYPRARSSGSTRPTFPHDVPKEGERAIPFSRELYIERTDFMEDPPKDFIRLAPGREVRLRHAYIVRCGALCPQPHRLSAPGRSAHCPVRLADGAPHRRPVHPAHRGHRPEALQPRQPVQFIFARAALAGAGVGRRPGCRRPLRPLCPERAREIYQQYAEWLVAHGKAYRCYTSEAELEELRAKGCPTTGATAT
jgi:hypothetical protein